MRLHYKRVVKEYPLKIHFELSFLIVYVYYKQISMLFQVKYDINTKIKKRYFFVKQTH